MNHSRINIVFGAALALAAALPAQQAQPGRPSSDWRIPIHTNGDDPASGAYGLWASGPGYKVSFDDGMTFYPVLGDAHPRNLPLRWRTASVAVGEFELVDGDTVASPHHTEWRYELRYPGVTEAYDVRENGVEQSFVIHQRPAATGDLVVRGRVTSELNSDRRGADHAALRFADGNGTDVVSYGEAFAFDPSGRVIDITSSSDGEFVELRVPAAWLASATYPVTIDPLVGSEIEVSTGGGAGVANYPVATYNAAGGYGIVAYSRSVSASDYDCWVMPLPTKGQPSRTNPLYADLATTHSSRHTSLGVVAATGKWVLGIQRDFATNSKVRVYVHDGLDTNLNSGTTLFLAPPAGASETVPAVGGATGTQAQAIVVFQRDYGPGVAPDTAFSEIHAVIVDTAVPALASTRTVWASATSDNECPAVTECRDGLDHWVAVWQSYNHNNPNDDWDVLTRKVSERGTSQIHDLGPDGVSSLHKLHPMVAGMSDRYAVTFLMRDNTGAAAATTGKEIAIQRFDWPDGLAAPVKQQYQTISATGTNSLRAGITNRAIAYDHNTDSHWTVAYRTTANDVFVARTGFTGLVVESLPVFADGLIAATSPAVCYDPSRSAFAVVYGTNEAPGNPLNYVVFGYDPAAVAQQQGTSCAGSVAGSNNGYTSAPWAGSEFYRVDLTGARPTAPTWLLAGGALVNLPLPVAGAPSCQFLLDPILVINAAGGATDGAGDFGVEFALPDWLTSGDILFQFLQLDGGLLYSSPALFVRVE